MISYSFLRIALVLSLAAPFEIFASDSDISQVESPEFPVKVCVGGLGYSRARRWGNHVTCRNLKGEDYQKCMRPPEYRDGADYTTLKIDGKYSVNPYTALWLKKQAYRFSSGEGSFKFDFRKTKKTIFKVDVANYGGMAIDPVKTCRFPK